MGAGPRALLIVALACAAVANETPLLPRRRANESPPSPRPPPRGTWDDPFIFDYKAPLKDDPNGDWDANPQVWMDGDFGDAMACWTKYTNKDKLSSLRCSRWNSFDLPALDMVSYNEEYESLWYTTGTQWVPVVSNEKGKRIIKVDAAHDPREGSRYWIRVVVQTHFLEKKIRNHLTWLYTYDGWATTYGIGDHCLWSYVCKDFEYEIQSVAVEIDSLGDAYVAFSTNAPRIRGSGKDTGSDFDIWMAYRPVNGQWSTPVLASNDMASDDGDDVNPKWVLSSKAGVYTGSLLWESKSDLSYDEDKQTGSNSDIMLARFLNLLSTWALKEKPRPLFESSTDQTSMTITHSTNGNVVVAWIESGNVFSAYSTDFGDTYQILSENVCPEENTCASPSITNDIRGTVVLAFESTARFFYDFTVHETFEFNSKTKTHVWFVMSTAQGSFFTPPRPLQNNAYGKEKGNGRQVSVAMGHSDDVFALWIDDLKTLRYPIDGDAYYSIGDDNDVFFSTYSLLGSDICDYPSDRSDVYCAQQLEFDVNYRTVPNSFKEVVLGANFRVSKPIKFNNPVSLSFKSRWGESDPVLLRSDENCLFKGAMFQLWDNVSLAVSARSGVVFENPRVFENHFVEDPKLIKFETRPRRPRIIECDLDDHAPRVAGRLLLEDEELLEPFMHGVFYKEDYPLNLTPWEKIEIKIDFKNKWYRRRVPEGFGRRFLLGKKYPKLRVSKPNGDFFKLRNGLPVTIDYQNGTTETFEPKFKITEHLRKVMPTYNRKEFHQGVPFKKSPQCPSGTFHNADKTGCDLCEAGRVCPEVDTKYECPRGYYCLPGTWNSKADPCYYTLVYLPDDTATGLRSQKECPTPEGRCLPGHLCPTGGLEKDHIKAIEFSVDAGSNGREWVETVVFPGKVESFFHLDNLLNVDVCFKENLQTRPDWMTVHYECEACGGDGGCLLKAKSFVTFNMIADSTKGVPLAVPQSFYLNAQWRVSTETRWQPPLWQLLTFEATQVVVVPESFSISHRINSNELVQQLAVFNLGCETDIAYMVATLDESCLKEVQVNWLSVSQSGFVISADQADPARIEVALNPAVAENEDARSTREVCIELTFLSEQDDVSKVTKKYVMFSWRPYDDCQTGSFSPSGDSKDDDCDLCPVGSYQDKRGQVACVDCPDSLPVTLEPGAKSRAECVARAGRYFDDVAQDSKECMEGASCDEDGLTLETLKVLPGYWRPASTARVMLKCPNSDFCVGGVSNDLCLDKHEGTFCENCVSGHVLRSTCQPCDESAKSRDRAKVIFTLVGLALLVLIAFIVVQYQRLKSAAEYAGEGVENMRNSLTMWFLGTAEFFIHGKESNKPVSRKSSEASNSSGKTSSRLSEVRKSFFRAVSYARPRPTMLWKVVVSIEANVNIRLLFGFYQVTSGVSRNFYEILPQFWLDAVDFFNVITAQVFTSLNLGCIVDNNHFVSLVTSMAIPMFALLLIMLVHYHVKGRLKKLNRLKQDLPRLRNASFTVFLMLLFVIYPSVSTTIFATFVCQKFEDGSSFLRADYSIDCESAQYRKWVVVAVFGTLVYPVGIVLTYSIALYRARRFLEFDESTQQKKIADRAYDHNSNHLTFLWEPYRSKFFWFEVFELLRKLVQTSMVSFVSTGTVMQSVFQMTVSALAILVLSELRPYESKGSNRLAIVCLWTIFLVSFLVMLLFVDDVARATIDLGYSKAAVQYALMASLFFPLGFAIFQSRKWWFDYAAHLKAWCYGSEENESVVESLEEEQLLDESFLQPSSPGSPGVLRMPGSSSNDMERKTLSFTEDDIVELAEA